MKIYTADKETGTFIEEFKTVDEAKERIIQYEEQDRINDCFEPDFYDIVTEDHSTITYGVELKIARKNAGLTQKAMSEQLEIPKRTIEDWERNIFEPAPWIQKLVLDKLKSIK